MGKHIIIKEARCSFPQLYGTQVKGEQSFNPGITLILEKVKHAAVLAEIKAEIKTVIASNPKLAKAQPEGDKLCLRRPKPDQDELMYLPDNLILKAGNPTPPKVLHPNMKEMTEETNRIYSGCYVNAKVEIWGQNNNWGKRINAKLIAVQFVDKPADSFDGSYISPEVAVEGFESIENNEFLNDSPATGGDPLLD